MGTLWNLTRWSARRREAARARDMKRADRFHAMVAKPYYQAADIQRRLASENDIERQMRHAYDFGVTPRP